MTDEYYASQIKAMRDLTDLGDDWEYDEKNGKLDTNSPLYIMSVIESKIVEGKIETCYKRFCLRVNDKFYNNWEDYDGYEFNETDTRCSQSFIDNILNNYYDEEGDRDEDKPFNFAGGEKTWFILSCYDYFKN